MEPKIKSKNAFLKFLKILGMFLFISLTFLFIFRTEKILDSYKIKYLITLVFPLLIGLSSFIKRNRP